MNQPIEKRFHLHACGVQQSFFDKAEAASGFEEMKKNWIRKKEGGRRYRGDAHVGVLRMLLPK
jgi:hypothetical protein